MYVPEKCKKPPEGAELCVGVLMPPQGHSRHQPGIVEHRPRQDVSY